MNTVISENAYAKLNLSLDVGKKRPDGYHDMTMVMQTVSLHDSIELTVDDTGSCRSESNLYYIPNDERNLAVKAARLYLDAIGDTTHGALVRMQKSIPVGAGMAGGSSDAAAVLRAMNAAFENRLGAQELLKIAENVGSDVAFCLLGGTALAEGRGERLTSLPDLPDCRFVILKPEFSISTPELFKKIDAVRNPGHPDTAGIISSLAAGNLTGLCRRMYNVFETVDDRRMRVIAELRNRLIDEGATGAVMTGTGSAVFGVFPDAARAEAAAERLKRETPFCTCAAPVGRLLEA